MRNDKNERQMVVKSRSWSAVWMKLRAAWIVLNSDAHLVITEDHQDFCVPGGNSERAVTFMGVAVIAANYGFNRLLEPFGSAYASKVPSEVARIMSKEGVDKHVIKGIIDHFSD